MRCFTRKKRKKYLKRDSRLRPHDGNVNKIKKKKVIKRKKLVMVVRVHDRKINTFVWCLTCSRFRLTRSDLRHDDVNKTFLDANSNISRKIGKKKNAKS